MFLVTRIDNRRLDVRVQGVVDGQQLRGLIQAMFDTSIGMRNVQVLYRLENFALPAPIVLIGELARSPQLSELFERIERIAFVADKPWRRLVDRLHSILLPNVAIQSFAAEDLKLAKIWLTAKPQVIDNIIVPLNCARRCPPMG